MSRRRWLADRPLHWRAALVTVPLVLGLCAALLALVHAQGERLALESTQRLNLGLARYVLAHQDAPLLDARGRPDLPRMRVLATQVMMVQPAVELYLLDAQGRVLAHALDGLSAADDPVGRVVNLALVQPLVQPLPRQPVQLPVLGDDPRRPGQHTVVSVAPVQAGGRDQGWLYIVLNGQGQRLVAARLAGSAAFRELAWVLALAALAAAAVSVLALRTLTRPLRTLVAEVSAFGVPHPLQPAMQPAAPPPGNEIQVLRLAVHDQQQRIRRQFEQLAQADAQRRELVGSLSHDLRTPLSNIRGYVETLLLGGATLDAGSRAAHLATVLRHTDLLGRRIQDLFQLSVLDAGRQQPQRELFCLAELLQDVVQDGQLAAQQRGVRLRLAEGSHARAPVLADIALIGRVLQNLVDNALRCTPAGGDVVLAVQARGRDVWISVADTGRGIACEHLPHIFERYWRAGDPEAAQAGTSAGLGLAIVKRILDMHGSVVRVHSELTRGTRFDFSLPQAL